MYNWREITHQISSAAGISLDPEKHQTISGGCINTCFLLGRVGQQVFIKLNLREYQHMFIAESEGLASMAQSGAIEIPAPLCVGISGEYTYIAMQFIEFGHAREGSYRNFGHALAAMHRYQGSQYGSPIDNTIGLTAQINTPSNNWFDFWRRHRLEFQLKLAQDNRAPAALIDDGMQLAEKFHQLFAHTPPASCLHGDLWQGNWSFNKQGKPVLFDPAHYFGDRETDLARTSLFGGAPESFYHAYNESYPLETGYPVREKLYNIYHVLNHYNLFGGGYASQAHNMIQYVLSELK